MARRIRELQPCAFCRILFIRMGFGVRIWVYIQPAHTSLPLQIKLSPIGPLSHDAHRSNGQNPKFFFTAPFMTRQAGPRSHPRACPSIRG